jgi:BirA family transcriptional regulator, biotin operon repressor / biotin---[acetyl-CoA-carboxylase] ligase
MIASEIMTGPIDGVAETVATPERVTIEAHPVLESTNILAKSRAEDGAPAWTVIQADKQSAGRGRRARDWASPPGNLYTSTILRPSCPIHQWPQLSFVAALSVAEMVERIAPEAKVTVKWPNDVLANNRKISGILLETVPAGGGAVIVGVGINIASHPDGTRYGATSLDALTGSRLAIKPARALYLSALTRWYDIWSAGGFEEVRAGWLAVAHGLGRNVLVDTVGTPGLRGRFTGIAEDGRMVIETSDGVTELVSAGGLSFLEGEEA